MILYLLYIQSKQVRVKCSPSALNLQAREASGKLIGWAKPFCDGRQLSLPLVDAWKSISNSPFFCAGASRSFAGAISCPIFNVTDLSFQTSGMIWIQHPWMAPGLEGNIPSQSRTLWPQMLKLSKSNRSRFDALKNPRSSPMVLNPTQITGDCQPVILKSHITFRFHLDLPGSQVL